LHCISRCSCSLCSSQRANEAGRAPAQKRAAASAAMASGADMARMPSNSLTTEQ
jgi:hypothetical protein